MREILFRGKTKDGEWVYGDLLQDDGKFYITEHDGWSTFYPKSGTADVYMHEVIPESVGQYTGLEDFYDTKIFEGDIIKWVLDEDETYWYEIGFYEGSFVYREICYKGNDLCWDSVFDSEDRLLNDEVHVVCNTFDLFDPSRWDRINAISSEELKKALEYNLENSVGKEDFI